MRNPLQRSDSEIQGPAPLGVALSLVALVPAACVLWFMTIAMRNDRLAAEERVAQIYRNHIAAVQRGITTYWKDRQTAVRALSGGQPARVFASIVRSNLADSAIIYDRNGKVAYPAVAPPEPRLQQNSEWAGASELEFQRKDYAAASDAYLALSTGAASIHTRAQALESAANCRLKLGDKTGAVQILRELCSDTALRKAASIHGALIVPNAQLHLLKLLSAKDSKERGFKEPLQETLARLIERLNDYSEGELASAQRQFLMKEVRTLDRISGAFPTLRGEELALEYLEHSPAPLAEMKLQRGPTPSLWRLPSADKSVVALYQEDRVRREMAQLIDALALPDVRVALLAPGEPAASSKSFPLQDASPMLPGWQLALSFAGGDPFAAASVRETRLYLWIGFLMVMSIALVALAVARYVSAQLRLARLKSELASTVSHELKTPLASMRALVDTLLAGRFRDEGQLGQYLRLIAKENLRLSQLIENFLAFSRMERGKQRFHFEDICPASIARRSVESLKEKLEGPDCLFELKVEEGVPPVRGDAEALTTVLINLLENALKYANGQKRIVLRISANPAHVCFEVEDNGIGLAPAEARKIFDRFYQVDQSLTRQHGGCGLGLSIVKFIVDAHKGTVEVRSELGKGSVFRVKIPLAKSDSAHN